MTRAIWAASMILVATGAAQQTAKKPFQAQGTSTIAYRVDKDEEIVETTNVAWQVTGTDIPDRPKNGRLVLRTTAKEMQVLGDIGTDATVTVEAWPMGSDLHSKPLYSVTQTGLEAHTLEGALWQFSRGTEEVEWWSIHQLGTGRHLFDTYVPLVIFSTSRELFISRYGALDVPPDDATDARLNEPHVVASSIAHGFESPWVGRQSTSACWSRSSCPGSDGLSRWTRTPLRSETTSGTTSCVRRSRSTSRPRSSPSASSRS